MVRAQGFRRQVACFRWFETVCFSHGSNLHSSARVALGFCVVVLPLALALERDLDRIDGVKWLVVGGELGRLGLGDGEAVRDVRRRRVHRPGGGERAELGRCCRPRQSCPT